MSAAHAIECHKTEIERPERSHFLAEHEIRRLKSQSEGHAPMLTVTQ